jgi:hypothetical protein
MQYTKTLAGYHGPNHDGDAIVIGCRGRKKQRQAGIFVRAGVELQRTRRWRPAPKWRVAIPAVAWLASGEAAQRANQINDAK